MKSKTPDMHDLCKQSVARVLTRIDRMGGQFRISDIVGEYWNLAGPKKQRECLEHHCRTPKCQVREELLRATELHVRRLISDKLRKANEQGVRLYEAIAKGSGERVWFSVKHANLGTFLLAKGTRVPMISGLQSRNVQLDLFAEELSKCGPDAKGEDVFDIVVARLKTRHLRAA